MLDLLIILMYLSFIVALGAVAWATIRTMCIVGKTSGKTHGIPVRRIKICITVAVVLIMVLSYIIGNSQPIHINTAVYSDTFWLRTANMFVFTGVTAIIAAVLAMIFSYYKIALKVK